MFRIWKNEYLVPVIFIALSMFCFSFADMSSAFFANQLIMRFVRNGIMVLALIIPIMAGMGLNFAVTVGSMSAQAAFVIAINYNLTGISFFLFVIFLSLFLSTIFGTIIGRILNMVKGKEMIISIIIGFVANYIYQLIFMVGFGTVIKVDNPKIVLSSGIGVNSMVDLHTYKKAIDSFGLIQIGEFSIPIFFIIVVLIVGIIIYYFMNTPFGQTIKATGFDMDNARNLGIDVDKTRVYAIIISTVLAAFGQIVFLCNMGVLNVYTGHLHTDTFACAALLAGGATIKKAKVHQAFIGILLLHSLFILSPLAGQNLFNNVSLGEYLRSFIAYGIIVFALVMNMKYDKEA